MSLPAAATMSLAKYLLTPHWRRVRFAAIWAAGGLCAICSSEKNLTVHHRNYDHLFAETPADVTCLCSRCNDGFEEIRLLPEAPARVEQTDKC